MTIRSNISIKPEPIRIGIGGPVGSGKTKLIERLLPLFHREGLKVVVVTNDLVTLEDAKRVQTSGLVDPELVVGVETGGCPHSAIREDPSVNIDVVERLEKTYSPDVVLVESGGDNLAMTFSADLVDYWLFIIDTAAGDDIPRKRGLGVINSDLLVVNKIDLAPYVGADLDLMRKDVEVVRSGRPALFITLADQSGGEMVFDFLLNHVLPLQENKPQDEG